MRVAVITNDLPPRVGGIQYYVDQLCRGLVDSGDEVTLLGSTYPGAGEFDAGAPYEVVRERTSMLLPTAQVRRHALELLARTRAEVVLFGAAFPLGLLSRVLRERAGVPTVAFTHGLEVTAARTALGRVALGRVGRNLDAVTYVSRWCRSELQPSFGPACRHEMLPPAVDTSLYHPGVDGSFVRRRHGIGDDPLVVCVSRLVERKGQDRLVESLASWRTRVPGTKLLVVGDGPHREALARLSDRLEVADSVVFTGQVPEDELPAHFACADVFAMPCRERHRGLEVEAFGIVFIQAQAVGVPVVAGDIGGVRDAVVHGETGVLVDGTDAAAVNRAVLELLVDRDRRDAMGAAAADWVAAEFSWAQRTAQLRVILHDVVQSFASASV